MIIGEKHYRHASVLEVRKGRKHLYVFHEELPDAELVSLPCQRFRRLAASGWSSKPIKGHGTVVASRDLRCVERRLAKGPNMSIQRSTSRAFARCLAVSRTSDNVGWNVLRPF